MKTKNLLRIALVTAGILLIPLIGQFPWTISDFVIMGVLLFGTGLAIDYAATKVPEKYRALAVIGVLGVFFLIWAQMAVGLVGQLLTGTLFIGR